MKERRYSPQKIELRQDDEGKRILGYAAVFYNGTRSTEFELWADTFERIMPGAFDRALKEDDVRALFDHDSRYVLGRSSARTLALSVDKTGLRYEIDAPDTSVGRDVTESIRRGDVTGSSFAFLPESVTWREDRDGERPVIVREINEVRLFDVGPVTFPAYETTTAGLRSAERDSVKREFAEWSKERAAAIRTAIAERELRIRELEIMSV